MPKFLPESINIYNMPGFLRAFQLWDVVFFYNDNKLYHYSGSFFGWTLYKTTEVKTKEDAEKMVESWAKGHNY